MDTIEGGKWLADQDLAWTLVTKAIERIRELENELGCFFDRNPDGTIHQKAFAGQTFDRTVHKGDLTGIEIMNRLAEQVWARGIGRLEEHRAIELIATPDGSAISGVLMIDMRTGEFVFVQAKAVLLATGGGPTMYRYHTPSGEKSCDGLAMALRAGLPLRDMEMVQFHPTGLLAGSGTRMTGTVLEEGLRGAGGFLLNGAKERFMQHYDAGGERATRDIVSRAIYAEMRAGRTTRKRRRVPADAPSRARPGAAPVQGHGRALPRLRIRPRGRAGRGRADGALHDGRRRVQRRLHDRADRPVRGRRGYRRRARCEPAGRQRRGEFDRVRRHCRREHGRVGRAEPTLRPADEAAIANSIAFHEAPLHRAPGTDRSDPRSALPVHVGRRRHRPQRGEPAARDREAGRAGERVERGGRGRRRSRVQPELARLDQPDEPDRGEPRDRCRGAGTRGFARRALPGGSSRSRRARRARRTPSPGSEGDRLAIEHEPVRFTRVRPGETLVHGAAHDAATRPPAAPAPVDFRGNCRLRRRLPGRP